MKFYPLIFLSLLIFSACSQDDTVAPDPEEEIIPSDCEEGCMTALINGVDFEAVITTAVQTEITVELDSAPFKLRENGGSALSKSAVETQ